MSEFIRVTRPSTACAVVTIDRPEKRNALNEAAWGALAEAFETLSSDRAVRAIVLTGVPGAFCAGDDILAFSALRDDPQGRQRYWDTIMRAYRAVSGAAMPVISAIDGPCIGGGCTLALRTDFRIAGAGAVFAVPPARLGLVYPAESCALLADAVGTTMAKYMLYSGQKIPSARAVAAGLAWAATGGDTLATALALAEEMALSAPLSVRASKLTCDARALGRLDEVMPQIERLSEQADQSADYREGAAAFAQKRKPRFTGA